MGTSKKISKPPQKMLPATTAGLSIMMVVTMMMVTGTDGPMS